MSKSKTRPSRPKSVELQLRQEAGFGCCKCGLPIIQYHHIVEYAKEAHERPEDMMVVCPNHHDAITQGAILESEQRLWKAEPYNIQQGFTEGFIKVNERVPVLQMGNVYFVGNADFIAVDDQSLLNLRVDDSGILLLSLKLFNESDQLIAEICENEWVSGDALPWDIEASHQYLKIRQKKGDIVLELDAKGDYMELRARLWCKKQLINITPKILELNAAKLTLQFSGMALVDFPLRIDTQRGSIFMGGKQGAKLVVQPPDKIVSAAIEEWKKSQIIN